LHWGLLGLFVAGGNFDETGIGFEGKEDKKDGFGEGLFFVSN